MPTADKNKAGGHSHPQQAHENQKQQGDSRKSSSSSDAGKGRKDSAPKESFGKSGAKDSH